MKAVLVIFSSLFLFSCDSGSDQDDGVPWLEKQVFNMAFSWSCESGAEDEGLAEAEAKRRCDCMKNTLEEELTNEEWHQLMSDSQDGENMEILDRLQPQFNACLTPPERELESEAKGRA